MAYKHAEGYGRAFANRNKNADWQADFQGEIMVNGVVRWLNVWPERDDQGQPRFRVQVGKPKQQKQGRAGTSALPPKQDDEDIPF